jgi:hypothetical protein
MPLADHFQISWSGASRVRELGALQDLPELQILPNLMEAKDAVDVARTGVAVDELGDLSGVCLKT